ncbi:MAG: alpha/beta fold hydrolase [Parahaliea sp.]
MANFKLEPEFIGQTGQKIFLLSFQPASATQGQIVFVPPFAEEMNRCRSLVASQARQFASAGWGCNLLDLYGTGDSDGEFSEATLVHWFADIDLAVNTVQQRYGCRPVLWGLRTGALFAWHYAHRYQQNIASLFLLAPLISGRQFTRQLVRQRIAAALSRDDKSETAEKINAQWQAGECVEIGGYELGGELMLALSALEMSADNLPSTTIVWLEHEAAEGKGPALAVDRLLKSLPTASVNLQMFGGPPFWQMNRRADDSKVLLAMSEIFNQ